MKTPSLIFVTLLALCAATLPIHAENACSRVDKTLSKDRAKTLGPVVAKHLDARRAVISESLRFGGWTIVSVATGEADDAYVFYSGDPTRNKYVTLWSGAAREDEESEIRAWALENAPGIPNTLATCFAWRVTKGRFSEMLKTPHQR